MILNQTDERPIFIQLSDVLKDSIISGAYKEGEQIPSITEFSIELKINPATALKGVNILVEEGLLYKKRGLGMFVEKGSRQKLIGERKNKFADDFIVPAMREAKRLGIEKSEVLSIIERGGFDGDRD